MDRSELLRAALAIYCEHMRLAPEWPQYGFVVGAAKGLLAAVDEACPTSHPEPGESYVVFGDAGHTMKPWAAKLHCPEVRALAEAAESMWSLHHCGCSACSYVARCLAPFRPQGGGDAD